VCSIEIILLITVCAVLVAAIALLFLMAVAVYVFMRRVPPLFSRKKAESKIAAVNKERATVGKVQ